MDEIYSKAIIGDDNCFDIDNELLNGISLRIAKIKKELKEIDNVNFNTRCNKLIIEILKLLKNPLNNLFKKYLNSDIGVIVATTNSGVEEYETTLNKTHCELGNPALFVKQMLNLGYYSAISTACSSGIRAFSLANDLINSDFLKAVIVIGAEPISKLPLYGFSSLEILTDKKTNSFSKNYTGINIGEAVVGFIVERDNNGIEIAALEENTDINHFTTPNPDADEVKIAIKNALQKANLKESDIDYINLHGTGTLANDIMEANAINSIFKDITPTSSTKALTGHCLGASASIEVALCCHLLNKFNGKLFPHIFDNVYNPDIKKINLVKKEDNFKQCKTIMNNSFGFGGANSIMILRKNN